MKKTNQQKVQAFKPTSAWDKLPKSEQPLLEKRSKEYIDFIGACKTERETIAYLKKIADKAGFKILPDFGKGKKLKAGSKVMFINKNRAMAMAVIGKRSINEGLRIVGAHLDVPRLDAKSMPLYEKQDMALFKTHYYGGIKKYQWATIPLSLHIFALDKDGIIHTSVIGEKPGDPVFTISDIAPHVGHKTQMDQRKAGEAITGEELNIIVGSRPLEKDNDAQESKDRVKLAVLQHLYKEYNLTEEDLGWAEIRAVPAFKPAEIGFDKAIIGAYGHDDRACVYAAFQAIMEVKNPEHTSCAIFFDKEEVGSAGPNGAQSDMVIDIITRLVEATSGETSYAAIRNAVSNTQVISADTNAPIDPSFEYAYDPLNSGVLGKGIWICKHSGKGGKSGSSEADIEFLALIRKMLTQEKIPYQFGEMGKVDEGGGGTIAHMLADRNMQVLDISLATISLHSPFELISKVDYHYSVSAYKAFMQNHY